MVHSAKHRARIFQLYIAADSLADLLFWYETKKFLAVYTDQPGHSKAKQLLNKSEMGYNTPKEVESWYLLRG